MKTENDILAEYVREKYPNISNSFDYSIYRLGVRVGEAVKHITGALIDVANATKGEEDNNEQCTAESPVAETETDAT